jgi:hypothetical protein
MTARRQQPRIVEGPPTADAVLAWWGSRACRSMGLALTSTATGGHVANVAIHSMNSAGAEAELVKLRCFAQATASLLRFPTLYVVLACTNFRACSRAGMVGMPSALIRAFLRHAPEILSERSRAPIDRLLRLHAELSSLFESAASGPSVALNARFRDLRVREPIRFLRDVNFPRHSPRASDVLLVVPHPHGWDVADEEPPHWLLLQPYVVVGSAAPHRLVEEKRGTPEQA